MRRLLGVIRLVSISLVAAVATTAFGQEVTLRHAQSGAALDALATLALRFNDEQKGKAKVVLEDLSGISDSHRLPHMALLDDEDARLFFGSRPRFLPLADVMKMGGQAFDAARLLPQMADAIDDLRGRPQALPLALVLPVLFYNKEAFAKAGLDPQQPPKTWWETQQVAGKLFDAGYKCPLTTSRFSWVHLENLSAQHGEPVLAKGSHGDRFAFNNLVHVKHLALLTSWHKSSYFHYFGPGREGDAKFASGECAMLTGESGLYGELRRSRQFPVGVAELPYYEDVFGVRPANVLPDGAALWTLPGMKKAEYAVVARFIVFLMRPDVQRQWVRATGFLPMTAAALDEMAAAGVSPAIVDAARRRLTMPKQDKSRLRPGESRGRLHAILGEEVEFVWKNLKPAKEALDTAMQRANSAR
ncbi:MAG: extracellular solute-binding protein [Rhodocyclaceae bacterium]|nr:extracellular solute-binding protein [Rhodocyclaceae bacterium]